jgi:hypothetical protein
VRVSVYVWAVEKEFNENKPRKCLRKLLLPSRSGAQRPESEKQVLSGLRLKMLERHSEMQVLDLRRRQP